jgi:hypothetical protein
VKPLKFPLSINFVKTDSRGRPRQKARLPAPLEEIRSCFLACVAVFGRHNLVPGQPVLQVEISTTPVIDPSKPEERWGGLAWRDKGRLRFYVRDDPDKNLTLIIHEYLHLVGYDGERLVSTLTARFKAEIARVASVLLAGYYRGAAYLAHARPGGPYRPKPGVPDKYNDDQWLKVKVVWKKRKKKQ